MSARAARGAPRPVAGLSTTLLVAALLAAALLAASSGGALAQERRLIHTPPDTLAAGQPWECVVQVARAADWEAIELFHRVGGGPTFSLLALHEERGAFRVTVPAEAIAPPALEYYLVGRLADGSLVFLPEEEPETVPFRVAVGAAASSRGIILLSPGQGEVTLTDMPEVGVLFDPPLPDSSAAIFFLDGVDRTAECERSIDFLLYVPRAALSAGAHEATVIAYPDSGGPQAVTWRFSVLAASPAGAPPPVSRGEPGARMLWGRCEVGWALVTAEGDPDPGVLPYDESSDLAFDFLANGTTADGRTSIHVDAVRDPIYDDDVRGSARVEYGGLRLEAGDIYPYLSELSVAWQSGKGALFESRGGRATFTLLGLRTLEAEVVEGFGTFSRYLYAGATTVRVGQGRVGVNLAYAHDREASIPDSTRISDPQINRVASVLLGRRIGRAADVYVEAATSGTSGPRTESGNAFRVVATVGDLGANRLLVEYRDTGRGFASVGSPTVDSGEHGVLVDMSGKLPARLRGSARAEIYGDRDIFPALEEGSPILQCTARLDHDLRGRAGSLASYLFARYYRVPYDDIPYRSGSATLGSIWQRGRGSLSASVTRGHTESGTSLVDQSCPPSPSGPGAASVRETEEEEWSAAATASLSRILGRLTGRVGLRWTALEPELACRQDRWTATGEASLALLGASLLLEYQRIDNDEEKTPEESFVEHLVTVSVGRNF